MPAPPQCTRLGRHCQELALTVRIADLQDDGPLLQDAAATWLLGHTERITFGKPHVKGDELVVDATVHVPCKYLEIDDGEGRRGTAGDGEGGRGQKNGTSARPRARCAAHGFRGPLPRSTQTAPQDRPLFHRANNTFQLFYKRRQRVLELPLKRAAQRALPVVQSDNPCLGAPCRTADNKQGAACCRDITLDVLLPESASRTEALLKARKSPYLCKVSRQDPDSLECEVITRCSYLDDDLSCALHDRLLPNNQLAKPSICRIWPDLEPDEVGHTGFRLV